MFGSVNDNVLNLSSSVLTITNVADGGSNSVVINSVASNWAAFPATAAVNLGGFDATNGGALSALSFEGNLVTASVVDVADAVTAGYVTAGSLEVLGSAVVTTGLTANTINATSVTASGSVFGNNGSFVNSVFANNSMNTTNMTINALLKSDTASISSAVVSTLQVASEVVSTLNASTLRATTGYVSSALLSTVQAVNCAVSSFNVSSVRGDTATLSTCFLSTLNSRFISGVDLYTSSVQTSSITASTLTLLGSVVAGLTTVSYDAVTGGKVSVPSLKNLTLTTGSTDAIQISGSGNVGINKAPGVALDVNGQVAAASATTSGNASIGGTLTATGNCTFNSNVYTGTGGRLGVRTTAPEYACHVETSYNNDGLLVAGAVNPGILIRSPFNANTRVTALSQASSASAKQLQMYNASSDLVSGDAAFTWLGNGAAERMRLLAGGNLSLGGLVNPSYQIQLSTDGAAKTVTSSWAVTSDARIKKNIVDADLDTCYNNLKGMRLRFFEWDPEYYDAAAAHDRHVVGFVAQEVRAVFPKAVRVVPRHEFIVHRTDLSGAEVEERKYLDDFLTLNVDQIEKAHVGATQLLMRKVEALEAQNAALVARLEALESRFI